MGEKGDGGGERGEGETGNGGGGEGGRIGGRKAGGAAGVSHHEANPFGFLSRHRVKMHVLPYLRRNLKNLNALNCLCPCECMMCCPGLRTR